MKTQYIMSEGDYCIEIYPNSDNYSQDVKNSAEILYHLQKINGQIPLCSGEERIGMGVSIRHGSKEIFNYEGNILNDKQNLQELEKTLKEINGFE